MMIAESRTEAGMPQTAEENGSKNELPGLYANELGKNMLHARHDSPTNHQERTGEAHFPVRAQVHAYDFKDEEGTFPENRSYVRWKSKHNHLFGNSAADMVSDLGKKLENSARIVQSCDATNRVHLNDETIGPGPAYSTPYNDHSYQGGQVMMTPVRPPYSVPSSNNPALNQMHHTMSPFRGDSQHNLPADRYYDPELDSYQRNHITASRQGFDPRHCHDNFPGFTGHDCTPNSVKHHKNLTPNHYSNESPKEFIPYPYDPQISPGFRGYDCNQSNARHLNKFTNNCTNRTVKQFVPYGNDPQVNPGEKHFVNQCNCGNPKCGTPVQKCPCCPLERPRCFSERRRNAESEFVQTTSKKKEMSVKRLYRIVWLQNEQLALLQRQIDKLTAGLNNDPTSSEKVGEGEQKITHDIEKVSVGVMTSFLDKSDTPESPSTINRNDMGMNDLNVEKYRKTDVENVSNILADSHSPEESSKQKMDVGNGILRVDREESFTLHGIDIPLTDETHSPQTSFHLDMNEYKSDDSSSSLLSSDEETSNCSDGEVELPPVGWTFYDSVVGQVNNMLTKSNDVAPSQEEGELEDIRNATFDQLRQLGVSFVADAESQSQKRVTFNRVYYPKASTSHQQKSIHTDSDTSMHINALAMKYLKGVQHPLGKSDKMQGLAFCNVANGGNNLSFATLRYLERYQLVPAAAKQNEPHRVKNISEEAGTVRKSKGKNSHGLNKLRTEAIKNKEVQQQPQCSKILDITAIKQQPKLLPKKVRSN